MGESNGPFPWELIGIYLLIIGVIAGCISLGFWML